MGILRGKTPEMVRKEVWPHFLAYNLIRTVMAQAARQYDLEPRQISFKGTVQTLAAFMPQALTAPVEALPDLANAILAAIATHQVADRPDRFEPRARKRRYDNFMHLQHPRHLAKARLLKGICDSLSDIRCHIIFHNPGKQRAGTDAARTFTASAVATIMVETVTLRRLKR
jgi:hypothetical protein